MMIFNLFNHARFYYYYRQNRYAEALAQFKANEINNPYVIWAYFQLGLFETVANSDYAGNHWRTRFAKTVGLAACGRHADAGLVLRSFSLHKIFKCKRRLLAEALAPFNALLALEALQDSETHPLLYISLLLRLGHSRDAIRIFEKIQSQKNVILEPELSLLRSNAFKLTPAQQLDNMNSFLANYALAPLKLINDTSPPSTTNLKSGNSLLTVKGALVSVLMTAYNSADFIAYAIESLLAQTYQNIEIIVVDDASNDNTFEVVKTLAKKDSRIKFFSLPCNAGTFVAKTVALKHAVGEFITCHDSDDWSHPERIQRQIEPLLKDKQLIATTSHWVRIQEDGRYYARGVYPLLRLNPASPLFRRSEVLKYAGAWDLVRTGADSEFIARLKLVFGRKAVKRIAEPLAFGAHREGSLMTAYDTGYTPEGATNSRLAYWEAWGHWHTNILRNGGMPKLNCDLCSDRVFAAPAALLIHSELIEKCANMQIESIAGFTA